MLDNLTYHYDAVKQNRLLYVSDALAVAATPISLESQASDNYGYDEIGRIIKDKMRGITAADWTLANKPREMTTDRGTVKFRYDAMNEKIYREEYTETPTEKRTVRTWYVRDASGNILSIYSQEETLTNTGFGWIPNVGNIELDEQPLYGSNRIGIYEGKTGKYHRTQGHITFELNNHLGNVLSSISDLKRGTIVSGGKLAEYEAVIITQRDYLAFGLEMPDRSYNAPAADDHRFSFNGKEDDQLIGWQDYGFRWYDKKIRRFVSVDPLFKEYPELTTYQFASNSPVSGVDLDGLEYYYSADGSFLGKFGDSEDVYLIPSNSGEIVQMIMECGNRKLDDSGFEMKADLLPMIKLDLTNEELLDRSVWVYGEAGPDGENYHEAYAHAMQNAKERGIHGTGETQYKTDQDMIKVLLQYHRVKVDDNGYAIRDNSGSITFLNEEGLEVNSSREAEIIKSGNLHEYAITFGHSRGFELIRDKPEEWNEIQKSAVEAVLETQMPNREIEDPSNGRANSWLSGHRFYDYSTKGRKSLKIEPNEN